VDDVEAEVRPDEKSDRVKQLQKDGVLVGMVGDGINDAPALAQANIGFAIGTGTDVAIESAGITLLGGDISKLVKAIKLSKMTMRGIKKPGAKMITSAMRGVFLKDARTRAEAMALIK